MKRLAVVLLVVLVLLTGLPLLMRMGMAGACADCGPALVAAVADCGPIGVLAVGVLLVAGVLTWRLRGRDRRLPPWLFASLFERPPRWA